MQDGREVGRIGPAPDGTENATRIAAAGRRLWLPWEGEPPELPPTLPRVAPIPGGPPVEWYHGVADDGSELWGAVGGNGGALGPYVLGVYVLPANDAPARFPTFDEWVALGALVCVPGVLLSLSTIIGAELIDPDDGRCLIVTQTGTMPNTLAAQRWALSQPGKVTHGQAQ